MERQRAAPAGGRTSPRPSATSARAAANLRISRNINQPVNGVRPFPALSASSPIRPGATLGTITQVESTGFSSYHALSLIATKRLSRGLLFDTSYTWSKSLDTNSLNSIELQRPGRLRHPESIRPVRLRRAASVRAERDVSVAVQRQRVDARLADRHDRPVAKRQSGQHRHQQRHAERRAEHRASRSRGADSHHRLGRSVVRSRVVRGGQSLRQPRAQRRDRPGVPQHRSVGEQGRSRSRAATACSSAPTRSICSTIRTSARPATSSAVRPSARSREPACRPAKPVRRARFNWWRSCRSDGPAMSRVCGARGCGRGRQHGMGPARGRAASDQARADDSCRPGGIPGQHDDSTRSSRRSCIRIRPSRSTTTPSSWSTKNLARRRTPRCGITSA